MPWINPITDRTEADADRAAALSRRIQEDGWDSLSPEEKLSCLAGMKGAYNPTDLNRVGECVQYLADTLNGYGYSVTVEVKTDWAMEDLPAASLMETYLNNVKALIAAYYTLPDTPEPPESMKKLDWQGANAIEKALVDIKEIIGRMENGFRYCGTFAAGQSLVLPQNLSGGYIAYADLEPYTYDALNALTYAQIQLGLFLAYFGLEGYTYDALHAFTCEQIQIGGI